MTKQQVTENAAVAVALFWLKSVEKILARGDSPAKLSVIARSLVRDELVSGKYPRRAVEALDSKNVADLAIAHALLRLKSGQFPTVNAYFEEMVSDDNNTAQVVGAFNALAKNLAS